MNVQKKIRVLVFIIKPESNRICPLAGVKCRTLYTKWNIVRQHVASDASNKWSIGCRNDFNYILGLNPGHKQAATLDVHDVYDFIIRVYHSLSKQT